MASNKNWENLGRISSLNFKKVNVQLATNRYVFADAVVHHVLPLKDFGSSANRPENFKLLHPGCNLAIGTKSLIFLELSFTWSNLKTWLAAH